MAKRMVKKIKPKIPRPLHLKNLPLTIRHLDLVKQELKTDITTVRLEMRAEFEAYAAAYEKLFGHDLRFEKIEKHLFGISS